LAQAKFNTEQVSFQTMFLQAQYAANVTKNMAKGTANATVVTANATAESFKLVQSAEAEGLKKIKEKMGMSEGELIEFVKNRAIRDHDSKELLVAIGNL
jgi:2-hydroxy-3-keto-5-methylthiopentenyl-1-phosphate phosphatase